MTLYLSCWLVLLNRTTSAALGMCASLSSLDDTISRLSTENPLCYCFGAQAVYACSAQFRHTHPFMETMPCILWQYQGTLDASG
jgi:hypothetical protein